MDPRDLPDDFFRQYSYNLDSLIRANLAKLMAYEPEPKPELETESSRTPWVDEYFDTVWLQLIGIKP